MAHAVDSRSISSRLLIGVCAFLLLALTAALPANAMTVAKRDFPQLVARAEQIVIGTVTDISHTQDESGAPSTLITFSDLTVLKGDVGATLTLDLYGGPAGDVVVHLPDMPAFALGERAVLFVAGNGRDLCPLVGVWQGRFRVRFDAALGTDLVEDNDGKPVMGLLGRELLRGPARADSGAAVDAAPLTLDAFRELITDELMHPQPSGGAGE